MADNQITPFQLTDQFTMDNFNQRINETNIALQNKADKDRVVNPNLLDNWYFGNPVDQRDGYVVPPGTRYDTDGAVYAGETTGYVKANYVNTEYGTIVLNGVTYYVSFASMVRGYTGAGYGIDRWYQNLNSVILITDAGLVMNSTSGESYFFQHIEDDVSGKMVTFSALFEDGTLLTGTGIAPTSIGVVNIAVGNKNRLYLERSAQYALTAVCAIAENANSKCIAAKLELGTQQTLAHQDENGVWVLNEIPDYGEQLARCQRYHIPALFCTAVKSANNFYSVGCNFPVEMRKIPTISASATVIYEGVATMENQNITLFYNVTKFGIESIQFTPPSELSDAPVLTFILHDINADL